MGASQLWLGPCDTLVSSPMACSATGCNRGMTTALQSCQHGNYFLKNLAFLVTIIMGGQVPFVSSEACIPSSSAAI